MEHTIVLLGVLFGAAIVLSILFRLIKQSSIVAFIAVGIIAGLFRDHIHIHEEMMHLFTELGIILLLFMAGLEMDFGSFLKRWKIVLSNGLGQIILNTLAGALLGLMLLDIKTVPAMIFFGLCLTFSSTIIVISLLKFKKQMESYHGQIILGIMVLQDIIAVMSLVVLKSMSGEGSLLTAVGIVLLKLIALIGILYVLAKFVLVHLFKYLAQAKELLFLGSLGWVLGIAAICEAVKFSPEIGAFMAGAALSFLPYRLEIQDKVEPMKDFGVILFFLALGFNLNLDKGAISLIAPVAATAALVLFGTPLIMSLIGYLTRAKSRPTFYMGAIINQISEFSLILATLCVQAKVFNNRTFLLVTLATVVTMFFSSFGHQFMERLYGFFAQTLSFLDRRSAKIQGTSSAGELEDHVVVIKYNELAERLIDYYVSIKKRVLLIDIDPEVYELMSKKDQNLVCMYADIFDPDTWEEANFSKAYAIVSCMIQGQEVELAILNWLKNKKLDIPFIAATDSRFEALELYNKGATFVIQTEELAAEHIGLLLKEYGTSIGALSEKGKAYHGFLIASEKQATLRFT